MLKDIVVTIYKIINGIYNFLRKRIRLKEFIIFIIGFTLIIVGLVSYKTYYNKYYTFKKYEDKFLSAVKDFYYYHSEYLPKNGNYKTKKLSEVYEEGRLDELKIPGTKDICSLDSWVKVYNDNGKYIYNTYLKCSNFESNIDHEGPVIALKGDSPIYVSLNHEYNEPGILSVVDNKDGKIDINNVTIDTSNINIKKVGKYKVTYTVKDKLYNVSKVERIVYVTRNLTDIVKDNTDDSNYYKGNNINNYLLFSGQLFRIINVNSDGTVKLISNEIVNNLRFDDSEYENSNVDKFLNNIYLDSIKNKDYLVDTVLCANNVDSLDDYSKNCEKVISRKVGVLDINSLVASLSSDNSYLCSSFNYMLSSKVNGNIASVTSNNGCLTSFENDYLPPIRPVITLKENLTVMSGDGTYNKPFKLDDYSYGKQNEKINTRIVGEYVNFSGQLFRIIGFDDSNVTLISNDGLRKIIKDLSGYHFLTSYVPTGKKFIYDLDDDDNPGYKLNHLFIDYLNSDNIVKTKYKITDNIINTKYDNNINKEIEAKIFIPRTYDLFAAKQSQSAGYMYLYSDVTKDDENVFFANIKNGKILEDVKNVNGEYCLKIIITVDGNLLIKSGNGTLNSPYYIR